MEKHRHVFERFATFDNLYDGYRKASKDRRYQGCVLRYTDHLEENLINSVNQLQWHEYHVGELHQFYEYYPKKRIISSLPFYDRVINCGAYNVLWPIYLKSMYEYSYGSIDGRGPLKAAFDIQQWMRNAARMNGDWRVVKLDIAKFFFRIPVDVQLRELTRPLDDPDMVWFLETAVRADGRPLGLPVDCTDVTTAERISGVGMQCGSIISQMTGNVVLTPLDHYIKRTMHVPYYARFMDDMLLLVDGKKAAWEAVEEIDGYLRENLGLQLNNKTAVIPLGHAVEFVGRKISPEKIELRRKTSLGMKKHLRYVREAYARGEVPLEYALSVIQSYLGLMQGCNNDALRNQILEDYVLVRHSQDMLDAAE